MDENMNVNYESDEIEIDLGELFRALLKKWWLIAVVAVIGLVLSAVGTKFLIAPTYKSTSMLYVLTSSEAQNMTTAQLSIATYVTEDLKVIATSKAVVDAAIEKIAAEQGVHFTNKEVQQMLNVTAEENSRILTINAVSTDPEHAYWVADAVADMTAIRAADIMKSDAPSSLAEAELPEKPIGPSVLKNGILGFLVGAFIVCAIIVIKTLLNDNIKNEEDVERYLGVATLASIPVFKGKRSKNEEVRKVAKK